MFNRLLATLSTGLLSVSALVPVAQASTATAQRACDRTCMSALANTLIASMVAHRPQDVPLTEYYKATNNGVPASIAFMDFWRTLSRAGAHQYYIDTVSNQMFVMVSVFEGAVPSLLWGRLKIDRGKFSELELYLTRSRGDAGFIFGDGRVDRLPPAWTKPVAATRIPARAQLLQIGKAMFSPSMPLPPSGPDCALLENGGVVKEEDEWMKYNSPGPNPAMSPPPAKKRGEVEQSVSMTGMGCPLFPDRPGDEEARVDVVDTKQGVVVSIASLEGLIFNYPVTNPTWSAFVPRALLGMHESVLKKALATGRYRQPKVVTMPASIMVGQMFRVYDGKVQGFHMVQKLGPTGAKSPWTLPPVNAPGNGM
jgi:hypothetical protein